MNNYLRCLRKLNEIAEKVRDPVTRLPIPMQPLEVKLHKVPKRLPRPIGDDVALYRTGVDRDRRSGRASCCEAAGAGQAEGCEIGEELSFFK